MAIVRWYKDDPNVELGEKPVTVTCVRDHYKFNMTYLTNPSRIEAGTELIARFIKASDQTADAQVTEEEPAAKRPRVQKGQKGSSAKGKGKGRGKAQESNK